MFSVRTFLAIPFVRDVATLQVGQLVATACGFLTSILYARLLGLESYGQYAVVLAFTGIFGMFTNLGQQTTTVTFLAETYSIRDRKGMAQVMHYYLWMSAGTVALLGVLLAFLPALSLWLYGTRLPGELGRLILVASMLDPVFVFVTIALQTVRRIRLLTVLENAYAVFQMTMAILLVLMGMGVAGILWGSLLGSLTFGLIGMGIYSRISREENLPGLGEVLRVPGWSHLKKYGKDGLWITVDKTIGNLYPNLFIFILSTQVPPAVLGLVRIAFKLANLPSTFSLSSVSRLSSTVIPGLMQRGRKVLLANIRKLVTRTVLLHGFMTAGAMVAVPVFLPIVYGASFRPAIFPFLVIVSCNLLLALHTFTTPVLRIFSRIYISTLFNMGAMALGIGAFFLLRDVMNPLRALYVGLALFNVAVCFMVVPTIALLKRAPLAAATDPSRP